MTERKATLAVVHPVKPPPLIREEDIAVRHDVQKMERFIRRLVATGFYGKIVVSMQAGKITHAQVEQALKIDEL